MLEENSQTSKCKNLNGWMEKREDLILLENIIIIVPNFYGFFWPLPRRLEKDAD